MKQGYSILNHCHIKDHKVLLNGVPHIKAEEDLDFTAFIKQAYKHTGLRYPKFFKMDKLCKLGFICSEILLQNLPELNTAPSEIAVVLSNSSASLDTDIRHQDTIASQANYFPSPSVFVYTLPNIVTGEICIKNKFTGENAFFIFDTFDSGFLFDYTMQLLDVNAAEFCLVGWVELLGENYHAFMYTVGKADTPLPGKTPYTIQQIESIFQQI